MCLVLFFLMWLNWMLEKVCIVKVNNLEEWNYFVTICFINSKCIY